DLFLDQFTVGAEGLAALEAMALGKPVVCFIKSSLQPRYPSDFPIVIADPEDLADVIAPLIKDGGKRLELGRQSRNYVETQHDARKLAAQLIEIYKDLSLRTGKLSQTAASHCEHWCDLDKTRAGTETCVP